MLSNPDSSSSTFPSMGLGFCSVVAVVQIYISASSASECGQTATAADKTIVAWRSQSRNLLEKCLQNRLFPFLLSSSCKRWLFHGQKQLWEGCWGWFKGNSLCLDWSRCLEPTKVSVSPFTSICDVSPWGLLTLPQMLVCACFRCPCGWWLGRQHGALDCKIAKVHRVKI